jgi:hypothetical protein
MSLVDMTLILLPLIVKAVNSRRSDFVFPNAQKQRSVALE